MRDVRHTRRQPGVGGRIVARTGVRRRAELSVTAPHDHLRARPDAGMLRPRAAVLRIRDWHPGIALRIVTRAGVDIGGSGRFLSAPDDHLAPGPDRGMRDRALWPIR